MLNINGMPSVDQMLTWNEKKYGNSIYDQRELSYWCGSENILTLKEKTIPFSYREALYYTLGKP